MSQPFTVLVVDDNMLNMILVADLLEFEGYTVLRAGSAEEARTVLNHTVPHLLLVDVQMPGMDGLTFTRILKADPAFQHIIVVALTAFAMKGDREKVLAAGCDGYLSKPIDTRKFTEQVAEFLQRGVSPKRQDDPSAPPSKT